MQYRCHVKDWMTQSWLRGKEQNDPSSYNGKPKVEQHCEAFKKGSRVSFLGSLDIWSQLCSVLMSPEQKMWSTWRCSIADAYMKGPPSSSLQNMSSEATSSFSKRAREVWATGIITSFRRCPGSVFCSFSTVVPSLKYTCSCPWMISCQQWHKHTPSSPYTTTCRK